MTYLVLDLEMTGFEPDWHEIIQIGAVLYDKDWNEKGQFLQNVYPENEEAFSSASEKIHGLSLADLDDAPMIYDAIPEMEEWILKKMDWRGKFEERHLYAGKFRNIMICGQSVINDINFLKYAYRQEKISWEFSFRMLDLQGLAFFLFQILRKNGMDTPKKFNLDAIASYFGFAREGTEHNALEDALITGKCLKEVLKYAEKLELKAH